MRKSQFKLRRKLFKKYEFRIKTFDLRLKLNHLKKWKSSIYRAQYAKLEYGIKNKEMCYKEIQLKVEQIWFKPSVPKDEQYGKMIPELWHMT